MRIISGSLKGRRLTPPSSLRARPTTDFAKESLFNILTNEVVLEDIEVLDLFAGSGSIAFEFISRGASHLDAVDIDRKALHWMNQFAEKCGVSNIKTIKADALAYCRTCKKKYDLIFADPPYKHKITVKVPNLIFERQLLEKDGLLIVEHSKETSFEDSEYFRGCRTYGNVNFSFFRHE